MNETQNTPEMAASGQNARKVHSAGWYYADDVPEIVRENVPAGREVLINDAGQYGYQVYSSGGYCVQMLADVETLTRTKAHFPAAKKVWVVTAPSAYRPMHTCFLGRGDTKAAALADAFGPREAWGNATRRSMKIADVYETTEVEADELEHGSGDK